MVALTILITENLILALGLLIWLNRTCKKCGRVKCIERVFNRTCQKCHSSKDKPEKKMTTL